MRVGVEPRNDRICCLVASHDDLPSFEVAQGRERCFEGVVDRIQVTDRLLVQLLQVADHRWDVQVCIRKNARLWWQDSSGGRSIH
jgi:hypothetical protein